MTTHERSAALAALGGQHHPSAEKPQPKRDKPHNGKPHEIRIRTVRGGHIVTHHYLPDENGMTPEPAEHALANKDALLAHIDENTEEQPAAGFHGD
jgi:hypothetical protein